MDSILERIHNLSDYTNEKLVRQCGTTTKLAQLITLNGVNDTPTYVVVSDQQRREHVIHILRELGYDYLSEYVVTTKDRPFGVKASFIYDIEVILELLKESESYLKASHNDILSYKKKVKNGICTLMYYKTELSRTKDRLHKHRIKKPHSIHRLLNTEKYKRWWYKETVLIADCNRHSSEFDKKIKELTTLR